MELKYVWIKEYKNIHQIGFNFEYSGGEAFEFNNGELNILEKTTGPKGFFRDNISGVTAIVGKNGSGKTNLTEFINYNLAHATNGGLSTYGIGKGMLVVDLWIFVQKDIEIKNKKTLRGLGYKIITFENAPLDTGQGELRWHKMEENKYIYYNPTFDLRGVSVDDNLVNISTTMLAYNDSWNSKKLYPYALKGRNEINQLNAFELMEKERICDFTLDFENAAAYIDFLPKAIQLKVDRAKNNHFLIKKHYYGEDLNNEHKAAVSKLQDELDNLESFMLHYYQFEHYFIYQPKNSVTRYYKIPITEQKIFFFNLLFIKIFQGLLSKEIVFPKDYARRFLYEPEDIGDKTWLLHDRLMVLRDLVSNLIETADWMDFEFPLTDEQYAEIGSKEDNIYKYLGAVEYSLEGKNKGLLNRVLEEMDSLHGNHRILSYEPLGELSSGQKHLLTLFSRFFWAKRKIVEKETGDAGIQGRNIVIFIDEGEVALHPEWQRAFFDKVTGFLSELFQGRNIQLLITTHSPFVLSDIPKDNVIFLERDEQGHCKISRMDRENTLGANIYSLLADSFFMQNTIGSFAEEKMRWALRILKSGHSDYPREVKDEILYLVASIGEPVVRQQFEILYDKAFGNNEIDALQQRIRELEGQLRKREDDTA